MEIVMIYWAMKAILLVIVITCSAVYVPRQQPSQPPITVEFRLAETENAKGLKEAVVAGSGYKVYVHKEIVVTNWDILEAHLAPQDTTGLIDIFMTFTEEGANKMALATRSHLNKPLAIFVDGQLIAAPTVTSVIRDMTAISNLFTIEEAKRIANIIAGGS